MKSTEKYDRYFAGTTGRIVKVPGNKQVAIIRHRTFLFHVYLEGDNPDSWFTICDNAEATRKMMDAAKHYALLLQREKKDDTQYQM